MRHFKITIPILLITFLLFSCKNQERNREEHNHQEVKTELQDTPKKKSLSPHTSTMAMIGDAHIHIDYSSPGVRNRIIFGGLLAYDEVWQAGAHMATWIETNKNIIIDGKTLPAGKYGFFTIPSKEEWTIIFNSNWDQHGKDEYNQNDDVLRLKVKPEIFEEVSERLSYTINKKGQDKGSIVLAWEKIKVEVPFEVK